MKPRCKLDDVHSGESDSDGHGEDVRTFLEPLLSPRVRCSIPRLSAYLGDENDRSPLDRR